MFTKVSVIVPVYNCEKYLSNCLTSILNQTYKNIEIIIVNDGSTDGSESIIKQFMEGDRRILYFFQENSGPSEARNKAILNASGDYIVFIDADDTVDKYYIEKLLKNMISSGADLVCCGYIDCSIYGTIKHNDFNFEKRVSLHSFVEMICNGTGGVLWSKIFKKEIISNNKLLLKNNIFMSEDLVFVLMYSSYCKSFVAINEYLYNYNRFNQSSISSSISINYFQNHITVSRHIEKILTSVKLNENKIKIIIAKRIQDIVVTLVEQQSVKIKEIGLENAIRNVREILSSQYIQQYKCHFTSKKILYIPYLFFLKNNHVKTSLLYGAYLSILKSIKRMLQQKRKQASL